MPGKVKVGIIGSGFEADIHAASFQIMPRMKPSRRFISALRAEISSRS